MKRVYAHSDWSRIVILRGLMEDEGIETTVFNELMSSALGGVPFFNTDPEIWVLHDEDFDLAQVIARRFDTERSKAG